MDIITDNVPRHTIDAKELNSEERQSHLIDWAVGASFVRFGGCLYNLAEFKNASGILAFSDWDGYRPDGEHSGLVFVFVNNGDDVIIGTYSE